MMREPAFFDRAFADSPLVRLGDEDPDLFADLPQSARIEARARAIAPAVNLGCGPCRDELFGLAEPNGCLGLLVLDGLLVHSIVLARGPRSEIIGPGDLLRPWEQEDDGASVRFRSEWEVVQPARVAILDTRVIAFACRWPAVMLAILSRAVRRSHCLALQLAIADQRRVEDRLMLFFWHLADRWGRVRPDGVHVPLPVTHDVIAQLVCAQRPTVTSALRRLTDAGRLRRRHDRTWMLPLGGEPMTIRSRPMEVAKV